MLRSFKVALATGAVFSAVLMGGSAQAATTYESLGQFSVGNWASVVAEDGSEDFEDRRALYGSSQPYAQSNTLAESSFSGAASFAGVDASGMAATTTVTYAAQSQSSLAGGLKASATMTGQNVFWNNDANASYVNEDLSINPNGLPDHYSVFSRGQITDTLSVLGDSSLASVKFIFSVDGQLIGPSGSGAGASVSLIAWETASNSTQVNFYELGGPMYGQSANRSFDQLVTSDYFSVLGGQVFLSLALDASAGMYADVLNYSSGQHLDGTVSSNFFSTVKIAQVLGFNSSGERVDLFSVAGSDGTLLSVGALPSAVPEPATWAMMIAGFGLAGTVLRRRSRIVALV